MDSDDEYEVEAVRRDRDSYYDRRRSSPSIRREYSYEDNKSIRYPAELSMYRYFVLYWGTDWLGCRTGNGE